MAFESSLGKAREFTDNLVARCRINALAERAADKGGSITRAAGGSIVPAELGGSIVGGASSQWSDSAVGQMRHYAGWVAAAVRCVAERGAGQRIRVGRRIDTTATAGPGAKWVKSLDARVEPLIGHPLADAVEAPNELHTSWSLNFTTIASLMICGKAFWWCRTNEKGRVEIWPLSASWVRRPIGSKRLFESWEVQVPGAAEPFLVPASQMAYFTYPHPGDPINGSWSAVSANLDSIQTDEQISAAQHGFFARGIFPGVAITVGKNAGGDGQPGRPKLTEAQCSQIIHAVKQRHRGAYGAGEPLILDALVERIDKITQSGDEMAFRESGQMTKERILEMFGVSPLSLGATQDGNRAAAAVAEQHLVANVNTKLELLGQCATQWLSDTFNDPSLVLWWEPATPVDPEHELQVMKELAAIGAISRNEARAKYGMPPIRGGDSIGQSFTLQDVPVEVEKAPGRGRVLARAPSGKLLEILESEGTADE